MTSKDYVEFIPGKHTLDFEFAYNPEETQALHKELNGKAELTIEDLRRVSLWKTNRVLDVPEETLLKLSAIATKVDLKITDDCVKELIEELVDSRGVGYPMASSILKFCRPDVFPIIDVRAYRALTGKKNYLQPIQLYGVYRIRPSINADYNRA